MADLNAEQRHAVQHGIEAKSATTAPPLLVIAGAGSGKTKTLAHRVAHLVVNGVDPHRILLLTFTRRAAEEMIRRVKRITTTALGSQQVDLRWSGTCQRPIILSYAILRLPRPPPPRSGEESGMEGAHCSTVCRGLPYIGGQPLPATQTRWQRWGSWSSLSLSPRSGSRAVGTRLRGKCRRCISGFVC